MRHRGLKIVGSVLVGLTVAGLCLRLVGATESGQPFIGQNAYHLPVGTHSTIAVVVLAAAIGVYALIRRLTHRLK